MPVTSYSVTPANNNGTPPNGAPEGMAVNAVNDTIRQIMADIAVEAQKNAVKAVASVAGTDTITGSLTPDLTAYSSGLFVVLVPANTNTGAATLNIDGLGAHQIRKFDGNSQLAAGDLVAAAPAFLIHDAGSVWYLLNPNSSLGGNTAWNVGYLNIPQNSQSANYTLVLADAGKHIIHASGAGAGDTYTIPANASVAYPLGTVVTFINADSNSVSIAITTDTMTLAGTTTTGTRTLAQNGIATAVKVSSTGWLISGTGLS